MAPLSDDPALDALSLVVAFGVVATLFGVALGRVFAALRRKPKAPPKPDRIRLTLDGVTLLDVTPEQLAALHEINRRALERKGAGGEVAP